MTPNLRDMSRDAGDAAQDDDEDAVASHARVPRPRPGLGGGTGVRLDPHVTVGSLIQISLMVLALVIWAVGYAGKTDSNANDLKDLKSNVAAQIEGLRADTAKRLDDVAHQLAALPDQTARLTSAENRITRMEGTQDDAITALLRTRAGGK